jgi:hypothetical protein
MVCMRFHTHRALPESSSTRGWEEGEGGQKEEERAEEGHLTSSMVHFETVEAEMPATPGSSLQCCSQHTESERSGWADKADMKSDWCTTLGGRAAKQRQRLASQC